MRHYFKPILFVLGLLLFVFSCQKDDDNKFETVLQDQPQSRIQEKSGEQVSKSAIAFLKERTNNSFKVSYDKNQMALSNLDGLSKESAMGTVKTDKELVVVNQTNTKHTFTVETVNQENNVIINLIVVETADGIYEYFLKYTFDDKIPYTDKGNLDISKFSGTIESFNRNGINTGTLTLLNGEIIGNDGESSPCPEEEDLWDGWEDYNNDTSGGGGGGGNNDGEGSTSNNDNTSSGNTNNNSGSSGGGGTSGGGCDIYYADTDGERWELDEWSPSDGTESCCMYLIINCPQNEVISETMRGGDGDVEEDPCGEGMVGVLIDDNVDDCNKLKEDITDVPVVKTRLHTMKVEGEFAEKGLRVDIHPTTGVYTPSPILEDNNGTAHIKIPLNPYTVVVAHTHPPSDDGYYAMFSGPDIIKMGENIKHAESGFNPVVNPVEITHILIADGKTFAIRFDDAASVQTLLDIYENQVEKDDFEENLQRAYDGDNSGFPSHESTTSISKQQRHLYDLFSTYNLNMSMYEANYDVNGFVEDWQKINKETLEKDPCI